MASYGEEFDDPFANAHQRALEDIFDDAVSHSYETDERTLRTAFMLMEEGWFADDIDPDERDQMRQAFFDILDIETQDFDWDAWREMNGY